MVKNWHRLPTEVLGSPTLEGFKNCGVVALKEMVSGHGGVGQQLALVISQVFSNLNDSATVCVLHVVDIMYCVQMLIVALYGDSPQVSCSGAGYFIDSEMECLALLKKYMMGL